MTPAPLNADVLVAFGSSQSTMSLFKGILQ